MDTRAVAMPRRPIRQLERDLQLARHHGRWLSDDELTNLEQQHGQRRRLLLLLLGCVLIPPLWPLACGLGLYLLFPVTTRRLVLGLGISALLLGLAATALAVALLVALVMALL